MSRRGEDDAAPERDALGSPLPDGPPAEWTPEHVAARLVEGFEIMLARPVRIGPKQYGTAWPAILREFADLVDEEAMANARAAFVRTRRRPSADDISRSDEALEWPMRFGAGNPLLCDAVQIWAFSKAGSFSLAGILRARTAWAKALAANQTVSKEELRRDVVRRERAGILAWAEYLSEERGLRERRGDAYAEGRARLINGAVSRHADVTAAYPAVTVAPHEAVPHKVLSRTSLDRHLRAGLTLLSDALTAAGIPVR